jgi:hypothetical protein
MRLAGGAMADLVCPVVQLYIVLLAYGYSMGIQLDYNTNAFKCGTV